MPVYRRCCHAMELLPLRAAASGPSAGRCRRRHRPRLQLGRSAARVRDVGQEVALIDPARPDLLVVAVRTSCRVMVAAVAGHGSTVTWAGAVCARVLYVRGWAGGTQ